MCGRERGHEAVYGSLLAEVASVHHGNTVGSKKKKSTPRVAVAGCAFDDWVRAVHVKSSVSCVVPFYSYTAAS